MSQIQASDDFLHFWSKRQKPIALSSRKTPHHNFQKLQNCMQLMHIKSYSLYDSCHSVDNSSQTKKNNKHFFCVQHTLNSFIIIHIFYTKRVKNTFKFSLLVCLLYTIASEVNFYFLSFFWYCNCTMMCNELYLQHARKVR